LANEDIASHRTLGWRPGCPCYDLSIIEDQPPKPGRKKDEPEADHAARLAAWKAAMDDWRRRWAELSPQYDAAETAPCTVLDPFAGACTTLLVAGRLRRNAVGIEINDEYCRMGVERMRETYEPPLLAAAAAAAD